MSNKVCIAANGITKSYECKTTHNSSPYIKVNGEYLDLTTNTTSGLQLKVKYNNQTYRPLQTYTSTYSSSYKRILTTGYSGVSSSSSSYITTTKWSGYRYNGSSFSTFLTSGTYPSGTSTLANGKISIVNNTTPIYLVSTIGYTYNSLLTTSNYKVTLASQNSSLISSTTLVGVPTIIATLTLTITNTIARSSLYSFTPSSISRLNANYDGMYGAIVTARGIIASQSCQVRVSQSNQSLILSFSGTYAAYARQMASAMTHRIADFYSQINSTSTISQIRAYTTTYLSSSGTGTYGSIGYSYSSSHYTTTSTRQSSYLTSSTVQGSMSNTTGLTQTVSSSIKLSTITEI